MVTQGGFTWGHTVNSPAYTYSGKFRVLTDAYLQNSIRALIVGAWQAFGILLFISRGYIRFELERTNSRRFSTWNSTETNACPLSSGKSSFLAFILSILSIICSLNQLTQHTFIHFLFCSKRSAWLWDKAVPLRTHSLTRLPSAASCYAILVVSLSLPFILAFQSHI